MKTTLMFLELTSNDVQPVRDQYWSASAENRYNARHMPVPYQHRKPVRDQHWSASAKNRYHARHMPVPHQYQMPAPITSTGPALADQCRTSLSSPTYASAGTSTVCQHCARCKFLIGLVNFSC